MTTDYDPTAGLKTNALNWLWSQGTSTVFLVLIGIGVWVKSPLIVSQIQQGYVTNAAEHKQIAATYLRAVEKQAESALSIMDTHARETRESRRLITELLKRSDLNAQEFTEAVEAAADADQAPAPRD